MHFDGFAGAMESVGRLGEDDWIGRYFDLVGRQVAIQTYLSYSYLHLLPPHVGGSLPQRI